MAAGIGSSTAAAGIPRPVEAALASGGLLFCSPLLALASIGIAVTSPGPILFRQQRVGRGGSLFTLYKLRTMRFSSTGPDVTARGDPRITPLGRLLRRTKLDELPQLWNVLRGDMGLVGPRPEVPQYVNVDDPLWQRVLEVRPGITDPATLRLRDEESLLGAVDGDLERFYRQELLPSKLREYVSYLDRRSWRTDVEILLRTVAVLLGARGLGFVKKAFASEDGPADRAVR
jgi:lipopolysaccharide/colanic/teichoic acid biosynthesis glycosyltransferase